MISIGGTIGTGLFVGSGSSLSQAGPAGALVAYMICAVMVLCVLQSLAEVATYMPVSGSFTTYGIRFLDPALGFALGWNYYYSFITVVAADLVAASILVQFWLPDITGIWASFALLIIMVLINAFGASSFGEGEFYMALVKVVAVIAFVIVGVIVAAGGIGHRTYGFDNWKIEGAPFHNGFGGLMSCFIVAGFSFQGTEMIGVTAGESKNPRRDVPRAIRSAFWRVLLFYICTIFVIGLIVPWSDPRLIDSSVDNVAQSPFVIMFQNAGINWGAHVLNAVILTSVLSAGNSGLYLTTRTLYTLSKDGMAPKIFGRTLKNGTPWTALAFNTVVSLALFAISFIGNQVIYTWLVNLSGISGFMAWAGISAEQWRFRRAYVRQGYRVEDLPYKSFMFPLCPIFAGVLLFIVIFGQGYPAFQNGFDSTLFFSAYIGIPAFIIVYAVWKVVKKTKWVKLDEVDVITDSWIAQACGLAVQKNYARSRDSAFDTRSL
ncbi:lysine-specific permease [Martensiomyces pterosporus]|nr:lysine-specific permease [Martensiomyces pterosporus]